MIAYLKGKVRRITDKYVVIETDSVGYRVFVSPPIIEKAKTGQPIELYTHQYMTESSSEL